MGWTPADARELRQMNRNTERMASALLDISEALMTVVARLVDEDDEAADDAENGDLHHPN